MKQLHGVYLDYDTKLTTLMVPHKKIVHAGVMYYIGQLPEGDYAIHKTEDGRGYGGAEVAFMMEDCTIDVVKGPYSCRGAFDFGTAQLMAEITGCPGITIQATRMSVGRNLSSYDKRKADVLFEETRFMLGDWRERLRPEWRGLQVAVNRRGSINYEVCP